MINLGSRFFQVVAIPDTGCQRADHSMNPLHFARIPDQNALANLAGIRCAMFDGAEAERLWARPPTSPPGREAVRSVMGKIAIPELDA